MRCTHLIFATQCDAHFPRVSLLPGPAFFSYGAPCQETYFRKHLFYARLLESLAPVVRGWLSTILALRPPLSDELVVGVHVRVHDAAFDWPVVAPLPRSPGESLSPAAAPQLFDAAAPLRLFETALSELRQHLDQRVHFFIASNSEEAKNRLVGLFGGAACTSVNNSPYASSGGAMVNRTDPRAVQRALLDLVLLSRSALLVHSFGSSFGEEAAAVHLAPSVRLRVGGHILGAELSAPHCNNAVFENGLAVARAARATARTCSEESGEAGSVCTSIVIRSPCERFIQAWGVSDVFC